MDSAISSHFYHLYFFHSLTTPTHKYKEIYAKYFFLHTDTHIINSWVYHIPWQYLGTRLHPLIRLAVYTMYTPTRSYSSWLTIYATGPTHQVCCQQITNFPPFFPLRLVPKIKSLKQTTLAENYLFKGVHPLFISMLKVRQSKQTCSWSVSSFFHAQSH